MHAKYLVSKYNCTLEQCCICDVGQNMPIFNIIQMKNVFKQNVL